ncbi:MAG TPA: glycosyl transferase [Flavobacteriaceae bacterium]|jgi:lipopolysaccharide/colanic/teichoic acid biosynthesis glycosyltransferase|nr:glycosyl transferase [Flavobacteriaceae bacterium]
MSKRLFDVFFSTLGILILSPVLLIISFLIKLDSKGNILYLQNRVGKSGKIFRILKFRTMVTNADKLGLLTLGDGDNRITKVGRILRKTKLDELPQLFNVFLGEMSFVGPRPEVKKYVNLYTNAQKEILKLKPGITDYASIKYIDESVILGNSEDPEKTYINTIMPHKIKLNKKYLHKQSLVYDIKIIFLTLFKIFR